jgi:hypothetical protein
MKLNDDGNVIRMTVLGTFAPADAPPAGGDPNDPDNDQDNDTDPIAGSTVAVTVMVDEMPTADELAGVDPRRDRCHLQGQRPEHRELNCRTATARLGGRPARRAADRERRWDGAGAAARPCGSTIHRRHWTSRTC